MYSNGILDSLIMTMLYFALMIWGAWALEQDKDAKGECGDVFAYCVFTEVLQVVGIILELFLLGIALVNTEHMYKTLTKKINIFCFLSTIVGTVWSFIIYFNKLNDGMCTRSFYQDNFLSLWQFFYGSFVMHCIALCLYVCIEVGQCLSHDE